MKKLEYKITEILNRNRDGSHATQANRRSVLALCVDQLGKAGYKVNEMTPQGVRNLLVRKPKQKCDERQLTLDFGE